MLWRHLTGETQTLNLFVFHQSKRTLLSILFQMICSILQFNNNDSQSLGKKQSVLGISYIRRQRSFYALQIFLNGNILLLLSDKNRKNGEVYETLSGIFLLYFVLFYSASSQFPAYIMKLQLFTQLTARLSFFTLFDSILSQYL